MTARSRQSDSELPASASAASAAEAPAEASRVLKSDRRSKVWRVDRPREAGGAIVYKRFEYWPLRQALAGWLSVHPAQREMRQNQLLRSAGLPVAPIVDHGVDRVGLGCKYWLATPDRGETIKRLLIHRELEGRQQRLRVVRLLAHLAADLIQRGYYFRDFKLSNVVIDRAGQLWLIDVGSVRPSRDPKHALRMLANLAQEARSDGVSRSDQWRFLKTVMERCHHLGTLRGVATVLAVGHRGG